jgi:N-glycosylase/DNA lyase
VGPSSIIEAETARTLWNLVAELAPRRQTLLRALLTDNPRPYYTAVARAAGIPPDHRERTR